MDKPGYGPMMWGICVVLAFTTAVTIRFASESESSVQMSGGAVQLLRSHAGTASITAR
jgi:hypothetical protein